MLITHAKAIYFLRASGHFMVEAGIFDNNILVVVPPVRCWCSSAPVRFAAIRSTANPPPCACADRLPILP
jgi:hypothetical protein